MFIPERQDAKDAKLPLLLYLHGAGEMRGELHDIISEVTSDFMFLGLRLFQDVQV